MTLPEYQGKIKEFLKSMVGEEIIHKSLGRGIIIAVDDELITVRYEAFDYNKQMKSSNFLDNNKIVSLTFNKKYEAIKNEYERKESSEKIITFDDVIGLDDVKQQIKNMIVYPFKYKEIYQAFKRQAGGGILLYGAPGTGKTMIVKAISNEIDAKVYSIKCSDIASKWYGESQRKIKELFKMAKENDRSIIFFDEFDALATSRSDRVSHASNMVVSELLAQIDGYESNKNTILLIASTNKPWDIDSAFLRPGRFNRKIYVNLPDKTSRYELFMHELKDLPIDNIDYDELASKTKGYSNADIVETCNEAKDSAIKRSIAENNISLITQNDLLKALMVVPSTIVMKELERLSSFKMN